MTVEQLAESSQCNAEVIKNLEEGALAPSLTPLLRIAKVLGVRLGTFMDDHPQNGPFKLEADKHENLIRFSGKDATTDHSALDFYSLAYGKGDRHMEPFIIDVHPLEADEYKLSSHEGEEFIYVLKGSIEIFYGQVKQVCDGAGATVIEIPFYLCFGREVWALTRKDISGEAMALEA